MKRLARLILPVAVALMLAMPGTALAASADTTIIEQKWIDFQKAVTDQMVKDGSMTQKQADERMAEVRKKFAESEGDSIYEFFARKNRPENGCKDGEARRRLGGKEAT